uniref:Uncharacterized protein n=1 Tax=Anopheles atroparvus TaxID=41427 RepID=A0AAG5DJV9_ANOAO
LNLQKDIRWLVFFGERLDNTRHRRDTKKKNREPRSVPCETRVTTKRNACQDQARSKERKSFIDSTRWRRPKRIGVIIKCVRIGGQASRTESQRIPRRQSVPKVRIFLWLCGKCEA